MVTFLDTGAPIRLGDRELRSPKLFKGTTQRTCSPEQTLARIRPMAPLAGITRVADITGLDRIGIPVTLAMRPDARSLVGSSGKGTTTIASTVSGLMEALEIHHAEHPIVDTFDASYAELVASGVAVAPLGRLPLAKHSGFTPDLEIPWAWGYDIVRQVPTAVPYATVHLRGRSMTGTDLRGQLFQSSSNGLASGNSTLEAVMAGLNEVIERDAVTLHAHRMARREPAPLVDLDRLDWPAAGELVEKCRRADTDLLVHDITSDVGVPTYRATLVDRRQRHVGAFGGYGAHLDPEIALVRCITEAAQSRAVIIAGSRDDLFTVEHARNRLLDNAAVATLRRSQQVVPATQRPSAATDSFEADLAVAFERLAGVGLEQVIVVDLSQPEFGLDVVRVSVPGLEGHSKFPFYEPGERARRLLDG